MASPISFTIELSRCWTTERVMGSILADILLFLLIRIYCVVRGMGGVKRYPSLSRSANDGYRFAPPILVWGCGSQEAGMAANSSCSRHFSFFVRPRAFLRPDRDALERRAQPRSRLAGTARARQTASYPGHALTAASPALRLMDGTIGRAIDDGTWSWTGP